MPAIQQQAPTHLIPASARKRSKEFMRTKEVAEDLGVDRGTVVRWLKQGLLPYIRIGAKVYLVRRKAVDRLKAGAEELDAA